MMMAWRASLSYGEPLAGVAVVLGERGQCVHGGSRMWRGGAQLGDGEGGGIGLWARR